MSFKRICNKIFFLCFESFFMECMVYWSALRKHNASVNTVKSREKMEYTLLRQNHIIEKGMSMRTPRKGFGQDKVLLLIKNLMKYKERYACENPLFLIYPISTISKYIAYTVNSGINIPKIEKQFNELASGIDYKQCADSGIQIVSKREIQNAALGDFKNLTMSRHSVRYFSKTIPSKEILDDALTIAQHTPSACNRQGWKVHLFMGEKCTELLKWQGGARGFEEEPTGAFLITANMRAFLHHEPFQAYVDGGMYAMSLLYALHYKGLGTIPLSCGFHWSKLKKLHKCFEIPANEVPVEIVAFGELLDDFKIAVSKRKKINFTVVQH